MARFLASLLTIALCGLFAVTGYVGVLAIAAAVALAQLVMATMPPLIDEPTPTARPLLAMVVGPLLATGLMAAPRALVGATDTVAVGESMTTPGFQLGIGPGVAIALLLALLVHMRERGQPGTLTTSLAYVVGAAVIAVLLAVWVVVPELADGRPITAAAAAGAAGASLIWLLPGPRGWIGFLATVCGAVAGGGFGYAVTDGVSAEFGAALGLTGGLFVAVGRPIARAWVADERRRIGFEGVVPLALAAPLVYLVGQFYVL